MTRRVLWFATAYTIVILVHEAAHALTAWGLGLEATLFNFWVNVDPADRATIGERAAYGAAGPLAALVAGAIALVAARRLRASAAELPLLYLAAHGLSNFFGNLMSAAFVGDFANIAAWLDVPHGVRYAVSAAGAVTTAAILFVAGRELRVRTSAHAGRGAAAIADVLVPVAIGTAVIIAVNQPAPLPGFTLARIGEATFWIFAAVGAFTAPARAAGNGRHERLHWLDAVIAVLTIAVVRVLTAGIP